MSKDKSKKKGGKVGIVLFLILLIAVILVILYFFGGSFGLGSGNGGTVPAGGTVTNDTGSAAVTEETPDETNYIDVTVSEDKYLYNNDTITIDELIEKVKGFEEKCEVHITVSETATLNAVDDLKAAFDSNGIEYMIIEASE